MIVAIDARSQSDSKFEKESLSTTFPEDSRVPRCPCLASAVPSPPRTRAQAQDPPRAGLGWARISDMLTDVFPEGDAVGHTCCICFDYFSMLMEPANALQLCQEHSCCSSCLSQYAYLELVVSNRFELMCPHSSCPAKASDEVLMSLLGCDAYENFKRRAAKTRAGFVCPQCDTIMVIGEFNPKLKTCTDALCEKCGTRLCLYCRERIAVARTPPVESSFGGNDSEKVPIGFGQLNCIMKRKRRECEHVCSNEAAIRLARFAQNPRNCVKPCPQCFMLLHRYDGCLHMTCSGPMGCRAEFCWLCLTPKVLAHDCRVDVEPSLFSKARSRVSQAVSSVAHSIYGLSSQLAAVAVDVYRASMDKTHD